MPRKNDCLVFKYPSNEVPCLFDQEDTGPDNLWATDLTTIGKGHWIDRESSAPGDVRSFYFLLPKEYMT